MMDDDMDRGDTSTIASYAEFDKNYCDLYTSPNGEFMDAKNQFNNHGDSQSQTSVSKNKGGRPPTVGLSKGEKGITISPTFTEEEAALISMLAEEAGISRTAWLRNAGREKLRETAKKPFAHPTREVA